MDEARLSPPPPRLGLFTGRLVGGLFTMRTRWAAWKLALGYLFRTWDFGIFLAFLFLWKRRDQLPLREKEPQVRPFLYPH